MSDGNKRCTRKKDIFWMLSCILHTKNENYFELFLKVTYTGCQFETILKF